MEEDGYIVEPEEIKVQKIQELQNLDMISEMRKYRYVIKKEFNIEPTFNGYMAIFYPENTKLIDKKRFVGEDNQWQKNWEKSIKNLSVFRNPILSFRERKTRRALRNDIVSSGGKRKIKTKKK